MSQFLGVALVVGAATNSERSSPLKSIISDGRAVANALVEVGCSRLALVDKVDDDLQAVEASCKALGGSNVDVLCVKCNVVVPDEIDAAITATVERFGSINYCANCLRPQPQLILEHITVPSDGKRSVDEVRETTNAWQRGVWLTMRAEIRKFMKQFEEAHKSSSTVNTSASIVNISAAQGLASEAGFPVYCAAAHAIVGASKATAMDYLKYGIRINCVCPGPQRVPGDGYSGDGQSGPFDGKSLSMPPSGRDITSEDVARAVIFLLGDGASAITGVQLPVDGGWSLYHH